MRIESEVAGVGIQIESAGRGPRNEVAQLSARELEIFIRRQRREIEHDQEVGVISPADKGIEEGQTAAAARRLVQTWAAGVNQGNNILGKVGG